MLFNSNISKQEGLSKKILENLNRKDLFLYSETSLNLVDDYNIDLSKAIDRKIVGIEADKIQSFLDNNDFARIISLGNGQTSDIAKYISYKKNIPHICIPSIFSTNVSFTDKSCLKVDGRKCTLKSKPPETVVIDYDLMLRSDFNYHFYGLCDIISIYTALEDWRLSFVDTGVAIDYFCYNISKTLTKTLDEQLPIIIKKDEHSLDLIFELIMMSGYITNIYGSGRPESGSEHIFSKILESRLDIFHAVSVGIGSLLMSKLQNKNYNQILRLVTSLELLSKAKEKGLTKDLAVSCLGEIGPCKKRYTILDKVKLNDRERADLVGDIFSDLRL